MGEVEQWFSHVISSLNTSEDKLIYVLGNESTDLDSTVASITLALFLGFLSHEATKIGEPTSSSSRTKFIPLINGTRQKLTDKHINAQYIEFCGVSWNDLSLHYYGDYINEWNDEQQQPIDGNDKWSTGGKNLPYVILVDHNNITDTNFRFFKSGKVICVIDHHVDSDLKVKETTDSWPNLLLNPPTFPKETSSPISTLIPPEWKYMVTGPTIGSCCTLVGKLMLSKPEIFDSPYGQTLANLLLVTILKDTECLREDFKGIRWTKSDSSVVDQLIPKSKWSSKMGECVLKIKEIALKWNFTLAMDGDLDFLIGNDLKWFRYDDKLIRYPFASIPISLYQRSTVHQIADDLIRIVCKLYEGTMIERYGTHRLMAILSREDNEQGAMIKRVFTLLEEIQKNEELVLSSDKIQIMLINNGGAVEMEFRKSNWLISIYSIPLYMSRKVLEPLMRQSLIS